MRKTLGTIAAVVTAMSLIGVAWASDDVGVDQGVQGEAAVSSSITTTDDSSPVTTDTNDSTSTSIDGNASTDTSVADTTSGTAGDGNSATSTTLDDEHNDDDDHDDDAPTTSTTLDDDDDAGAGATDLGVHTYAVAGVGQVTIEVLSSGLRLVAVDAPNWAVDIEKAESDKIEIEFHRGEDEAEFEAELHSNGSLSIEIDQD